MPSTDVANPAKVAVGPALVRNLKRSAPAVRNRGAAWMSRPLAFLTEASRIQDTPERVLGLLQVRSVQGAGRQERHRGRGVVGGEQGVQGLVELETSRGGH